MLALLLKLRASYGIAYEARSFNEQGLVDEVATAIYRGFGAIEIWPWNSISQSIENP
jgi:hypothetical protein